ncbi:MAG: glycosyltransferase family 39 protein, partial [Bdellovibrionales bacterium]|nr:glycosyltransferase family 39 protein [Bdellovibrionales bacterium]
METSASQSPSFSLLHDKQWFQLSLLVATLLFLLWFRFPTISTGLPYFTQEDEAHHFNRVVRMVQSGNWDPEYFHKPSLHFYLRMPIVALSFLWNVREGHIRKIEEIQTKNPYGIAGYSFTASHIGIVKWNRAFSVLLIMLSLWLTYLVAFELTSSFFLSLIALILAGVSPELLRYSGTIGVDVVMTFFCLLTTYLATRFKKEDPLSSLLALGVCAGLAVSSKYNALPIMGLPLFVCLLNKRFNAQSILVSLLSPVVGFFLGSPYILASLPLFLNQFAYEIWHYGVAGHVGHTAEPGTEQAIFYTKWLASDGLGTLGALLTLFGVLALLKKPNRKALSALWFPLFFFLLMVSQRANFTRNMIVVIPFAACFVAYGLSTLLRFFSPTSILRPIAVGVVLLFLIGEPVTRAFEIRFAMASQEDSRDSLSTWIRSGKLTGETAISGKLWASREVTTLPSLTQYDPSQDTPLDLYLQGYTNIITGPKGLEHQIPLLNNLTSTLKEFPGETTPQ